MTADDLREIGKPHFPEAVVISLNSKYPEIYSSFKVSVYRYNLNTAMNPAIWPHGTHYSLWRH